MPWFSVSSIGLYFPTIFNIPKESKLFQNKACVYVLSHICDRDSIFICAKGNIQINMLKNNKIDLHNLGGKMCKEYFICKSVKHLGPQVVNANIKR